eukprot:CAMPEP_0182431544 /NCGR_PEP_ID=MMETSP1167-20130531/50054_1 /TAXON_ID=2988 /ORGANISM="Mallomonas Sp, Strain CCMP3275" /LENGTH=217 /DNA_ID=CAMNT_0024618015 /DNA_START=6 /DNA_END=656 /DNA_ORIENTATION=+
MSSITSSKNATREWKKGKWTTEEHDYANMIVSCFKAGYAPGCGQTTLRCYVAEKINCNPMRVSKKFSGLKGLGEKMNHLNSFNKEIELKMKTILEEKRSAFTAKEVEIERRANNKRKTYVPSLEQLLSGELLSDNARNKKRSNDEESVTRSDNPSDVSYFDESGKKATDAIEVDMSNVFTNLKNDENHLYEGSCDEELKKDQECEECEELLTFIEDW